jgi:hypothetical protein
MAYRSSSSTSFTGTTVLTATAPAGVVAADRLLAAITQDSAASAFTPATGWTSISNGDQASPDGQSTELFEKKNATGSDSYNFVTDNNTRDAIVQVVALSGRDNVAAATFSNTTNTTSNATPISVSMTGVTAVLGDDIVVYVSLDQTVTGDTWSFTPPASYTERHDVTVAEWSHLTTATQDSVSAGATGALALTATRLTGSGNAGYGGWVVAVPVAAVPYTVESQGPRYSTRHPALSDPPLDTRALLNVLGWV